MNTPLQKGGYLQDIPFEEYQAISPLIEEDIYVTLQPETAVKRRHSLGGTGFDQVRLQLDHAHKELLTEN